MITVYNVKTGDSVTVHGVDAREYVKTGGWSLTPPVVKKPTLKTVVKKTRKKPVKKAK